jgi:peptide/nickel transport system ATP-binding protein
MLEVQHLTVSIQGREIVRDVSLTLAPGEIVALAGESGSGKSMSLLALMDLLPPNAGRRGKLMLDGSPLTAAARGAKIGMVFQEPMTALNPLMSIGAQISEGPRLAGGFVDVPSLLHDVGLDISPSRYPHELSGGQRQRVCLAMAIARGPRLLLADEPTTALDVTSQAQILALFKRLAQEKAMGICLVTHDLGVVGEIADRTLILKDGAVVESGPTRHLFAHLSHPYARGLLAAARPAPRRQHRADTEVVLTARQLGCQYADGTRALKDVSLALHRSEILGVLGESGSGKSTLARALMGLQPEARGEIRIGDAKDPTRPQERRRDMQMVFQDPYSSFNPRHTIGRIVAEPLHLERSPTPAAERVTEALRQVGLDPSAATKFPHAFSGGQRQRIAIARALILKPKVVVLDEALSALDVSTRGPILDLIRDLAEQLGLAFLFISHDVTVVRAITHRVMVMRHGEVVETGKTEEVLSSPQHPYTAALVAATPSLDWLDAA